MFEQSLKPSETKEQLVFLERWMPRILQLAHFPAHFAGLKRNVLLQIESLDCSPCQGLACELVARNDICIYLLDAVESRADSAQDIVPFSCQRRVLPGKIWQRTSFCKRVTPTNSVTWISWIHYFPRVCCLSRRWSVGSCRWLELGDLHIFLLSFRGFRGAQFLFDPLAAGHGGCHGTDGLKVFLFGVPICQNGREVVQTKQVRKRWNFEVHSK